jgi:excisionase family DNA binding protein
MNTATVVRRQLDNLERRGYSPAEAARIVGCGRTKIYDLIKEGRIRPVKVGARTIIPKSEIDRLLNGDDDTRAA